MKQKRRKGWRKKWVCQKLREKVIKVQAAYSTRQKGISEEETKY